MACRVDVLADLSLLLVVLYDEVSFDDLSRIRTEQAADPVFDASFDQLVIFPPNATMIFLPMSSGPIPNLIFPKSFLGNYPYNSELHRISSTGIS
ncbi:MAG: hypothetical protein WD002_15305 [Pseudomonadales bacterium]